MRTKELPEDVARFLAVTRLRIPHLETILLLRANPGENWDSTRLSARLYVSRAGARSVLRALAELRIVAEDPMNAGSFRLAALESELDQALARLAERDPGQARLVELRYFGGLTEAETADALGVSPATVKRDSTLARAWLNRELQA